LRNVAVHLFELAAFEPLSELMEPFPTLVVLDRAGEPLEKALDVLVAPRQQLKLVNAADAALAVGGPVSDACFEILELVVPELGPHREDHRHSQVPQIVDEVLEAARPGEER